MSRLRLTEKEMRENEERVDRLWHTPVEVIEGYSTGHLSLNDQFRQLDLLIQAAQAIVLKHRPDEVWESVGGEDVHNVIEDFGRFLSMIAEKLDAVEDDVYESLVVRPKTVMQ